MHINDIMPKLFSYNLHWNLYFRFLLQYGNPLCQTIGLMVH